MKLSNTLNGLQNLAPNENNSKLPILLPELRQLWKVLDLENEHKDRTRWVFWLKKWKGALRYGDLVRRRDEHRRDWNPSTDTHRGRKRIEVLLGTDGRKQGVRLMLEQNPSKTDPRASGLSKSGFDRNIDGRTQCYRLSAGTALWVMLKGGTLG